MSAAKAEIIARLLEPGVIAILRAPSSAGLLQATAALIEGGITAVEVTLTTPDALEVITEVAARFEGRVCMGVGTVLDTDACRAAVLAGAQFVVTPVARPDVVRMCNRFEKPIACGAWTPTEALIAHEAGADFIKLFPAEVGGPAYVKTLLAPLPMLRIIPTGGVTPQTAGDFLRAGCVALGAGSALVTPEMLRKRDTAAITARAREFVAAVKKAR